MSRIFLCFVLARLPFVVNCVGSGKQWKGFWLIAVLLLGLFPVFYLVPGVTPGSAPEQWWMGLFDLLNPP